MGTKRDQDRLAQGRAAVLSVRRAAELLPIGDAAGRAWLRRQGLVRRLEGADVVVWADVLDRIRDGALPPAAKPTRGSSSKLCGARTSLK